MPATAKAHHQHSLRLRLVLGYAAAVAVSAPVGQLIGCLADPLGRDTARLHEARLAAKPWYLRGATQLSREQLATLTGLWLPERARVLRASVSCSQQGGTVGQLASAKVLVPRPDVSDLLGSLGKPRSVRFTGMPLDAAGEFWDTPDDAAFRAYVWGEGCGARVGAEGCAFQTVFVDLTRLRCAVIYVYWYRESDLTNGGAPCPSSVSSTGTT